MKKILFLIILVYTGLIYSQQKIIENVSIKIQGKKVTIGTLNNQTVSYYIYNTNKPSEIHSQTTLTNIKGTSTGYYPLGNYVIKVTKNGRTRTARFTIK